MYSVDVDQSEYHQLPNSIPLYLSNSIIRDEALYYGPGKILEVFNTLCWEQVRLCKDTVTHVCERTPAHEERTHNHMSAGTWSRIDVEHIWSWHILYNFTIELLHHGG